MGTEKSQTDPVESRAPLVLTSATDMAASPTPKAFAASPRPNCPCGSTTPEGDRAIGLVLLPPRRDPPVMGQNGSEEDQIGIKRLRPDEIVQSSGW